MSLSVLLRYSSKSFIVSGLTVRSLIYFEFIFLYGVRKCNFILLHVAVQFSQHHLLKRLSLPHCVFLPPLSKTRYLQVHGFISGLYLIPLVCIFIFVPVPNCPDDCSFVVQSEPGRWIPPGPFFSLKTALAIQGLLSFHMNCEIF